MPNVPSLRLRLATRNYKAAIIISARLVGTDCGVKGRTTYRKFNG
jgi:hypothetical protein